MDFHYNNPRLGKAFRSWIYNKNNNSQGNVFKMDEQLRFKSIYNETVTESKGGSYYGYNNNVSKRYYELSLLMPFGLLLAVCTIVFILIIFRRTGLAAGIIAGFTTSISLYLIFLAVKERKAIYE